MSNRLKQLVLWLQEYSHYKLILSKNQTVHINKIKTFSLSYMYVSHAWGNVKHPSSLFVKWNKENGFVALG